MVPRWLQSLAAAPLALSLVVGATPAAWALVPYVAIPKNLELEATGLGIAQAATRLLRLGQADDAARLASLAVQLLPKDPRGWVLLAETQLRSNQIKAASQSLIKARQLDPRNAGILFAQGSLALRDGQPKEAIVLLRQGLRLDSKNPGAYFDLGNAQILTNNNQAALASFQQAAGLRKGFWEAINNQALVLFELGRTRDALERWRSALQIKPDAAEPNLAMAAALQNNPGSLQEAIRLALAALLAEPNYVLDAYQKEQLWGPKLRTATQKLLARPELKAAAEKAQAYAGTSNEDSED